MLSSESSAVVVIEAAARRARNSALVMELGKDSASSSDVGLVVAA